VKPKLKRILTLAIAPTAVAFLFAAPASATASPASAAQTAVDRLLADWQSSGSDKGMFDTSGDPYVGSCSNTGRSGDCWWMAGDAWMALLDWADNNPTTTDASTIMTDLGTTYSTICGQGSCPTSANSSGTDPFVDSYYDDNGWWEQTWVAAYKATCHISSCNDNYLDLAEQMWNYVTSNGWYEPTGSCAGANGVVQYNNGGGEDAYANTLYLRDSAWLYSITDGQGKSFANQYMTGNSSGQGGAIADSEFILDYLVSGPYNSTPLGTRGSEWMLGDHVNGDCTSPAGLQMWTSSQGEGVNALSDMYAACKAYGSCPEAASYYNNLADELAVATVGDTGPYEGSGQPHPTVDQYGVLSEPCDEPSGAPSGSIWPTWCAAGGSYLIFKGNFERALYCSNHNFADPALTAFAETNATSISEQNSFGLIWDWNKYDPSSSQTVNWPTQASALDGLNAYIGTNYAMC
jgi:glycosyl hydrolase family 76